MIFALPMAQSQLIDDLCLDKCNNFAFCFLTDPVLGKMVACNQENCPYEERRELWGECDVGTVWLRKLKANLRRLL